MAAGRPVIASAVGGLVDIVEPGVTGLLVPPNDPRSLADALEDLTGDDQRMTAMGAAGRLRLADFTTAKVGPRIEAAYEAARLQLKTPV
jgi:glycosyltransferase involved in cell wall biosynthesis